ncbi:superoxide dismutase [Infundibulicybe gibba]|nr:superoxide dismutase [Infundibulicybe gibba]
MNTYTTPMLEPYRHPLGWGPFLNRIHLLISTLLLIVLVYSSFFQGGEHPPPLVSQAVVVLRGDSKVTGIVRFTQTSHHGSVTVTGNLKGLDPNALRGLHIHQAGDATQGCISAGPHFNPYDKQHGAPTDAERHVGDLGNIKSDKFGDSSFVFEDLQISLNGALSIIGRSVVLHAGTDDLGQGGNEESRKTGNAGARAACGIIGLV